MKRSSPVAKGEPPWTIARGWFHNEPGSTSGLPSGWYAGRVAIVCGNELLDMALALRAVFDSYGIQVAFHKFRQKHQVLDYFANPHPDCSHTIIVCHGDGGDDNPSLVFDVVEVDGHHDGTDEGERLQVKLTAKDVRDHFKGQGTVISIACGSGRAALARAFLEAGYHAYIGPSVPPHSDAALIFVINFIYFLLAENRTPKHYSEQEATEKASGVDAGWKHGTETFAFYGRSED